MGLEGLAEAVASQVAAAAVVDSVGVPRNRDRRHTSARGYIAFRQSISSSNRSHRIATHVRAQKHVSVASIDRGQLGWTLTVLGVWLCCCAMWMCGVWKWLE